jgi:hypothetical protein
VVSTADPLQSLITQYHKDEKETSIDANMEMGIIVNTRKQSYNFAAYSPECRRNYGIKTANRSFENVT